MRQGLAFGRRQPSSCDTKLDLLALPNCLWQVLETRGFTQPLRDYILADRPYFGICLGMQTLFEASEECPGVAVGWERWRERERAR
jgi:imidazoleglycerol phosphate synthase glutamine amidotransferase subunit HisH